MDGRTMTVKNTTACGNGIFRTNALLVAVILTVSCGGREIGTGPTGPSFSIQYVTQPPVIDGTLNDECWKSIDGSFLVSTVDGKKTSRPTTFRAAYDSLNLYFAFECRDTDAASTVTEYDGPVYSEEHVAVYIDEDADRKTYAIIEVAPTGAVRDAYVLSYQNGEKRKFLADWRCEGIRVAHSVLGGSVESDTSDKYWIVEMAVPLDQFVTATSLPPHPGDAWLFNVYRAELTNIREYSALSPTGSEGFHQPQSFIRLVFGAPSKTK
jgi:hypothetical protein